MISTVCFNIFLIVLLIAFIFLVLAGMYYFGRKFFLIYKSVLTGRIIKVKGIEKNMKKR